MSQNNYEQNTNPNSMFWLSLPEKCYVTLSLVPQSDSLKVWYPQDFQKNPVSNPMNKVKYMDKLQDFMGVTNIETIGS